MSDVPSLKQALADWTDVDVPQFELAICLGVISPDTNFPTQAKGVFWTQNIVGDSTYAILEMLRQAEILEYREEPDYQYRWNTSFKGYWDHS